MNFLKTPFFAGICGEFILEFHISEHEFRFSIKNLHLTNILGETNDGKPIRSESDDKKPITVTIHSFLFQSMSVVLINIFTEFSKLRIMRVHISIFLCN